MDRIYIIGKTQTGAYNQADVDKINNFLSKSDNEDFEITETKELSNGELCVLISDM